VGYTIGKAEGVLCSAKCSKHQFKTFESKNFMKISYISRIIAPMCTLVFYCFCNKFMNLVG
jgi:hypothetical protein